VLKKWALLKAPTGTLQSRSRIWSMGLDLRIEGGDTRVLTFTSRAGIGRQPGLLYRTFNLGN
jgi:hypothetical protein